MQQDSSLTFARHEADGWRLQQRRGQLSAVDSRDVHIEVVGRVRTQVHLVEDGSDVILEEAIEVPVHLKRPAQHGEGAGEAAVVVGVTQVKGHISAGFETLREREVLCDSFDLKKRLF